MKKLFVVLFLGLIFNIYAVFQYEVVESSVAGAWGDGGNNNGIYGHAFTIRVTEGEGSIYIVDRIDSLYGGNNELLSLRVAMDSANNYGWVDVNTGMSYSATGNTVVLYSASMGAYQEVVTQTGYELGHFSAGDEIGVWLRPMGRNYTGASVFAKDNPINSQQMNYREGYAGIDMLGNVYHQLDFKNDGAIFLGVYGVESLSIGQPLPGVVATFALGLCGFGMFGKNKRKKK